MKRFFDVDSAGRDIRGSIPVAGLKLKRLTYGLILSNQKDICIRLCLDFRFNFTWYLSPQIFILLYSELSWMDFIQKLLEYNMLQFLCILIEAYISLFSSSFYSNFCCPLRPTRDQKMKIEDIGHHHCLLPSTSFVFVISLLLSFIYV